MVKTLSIIVLSRQSTNIHNIYIVIKLYILMGVKVYNGVSISDITISMMILYLRLQSTISMMILYLRLQSTNKRKD